MPDATELKAHLGSTGLRRAGGAPKAAWKALVEGAQATGLRQGPRAHPPRLLPAAPANNSVRGIVAAGDDLPTELCRPGHELMTDD
jgi:hypothetical protein